MLFRSNGNNIYYILGVNQSEYTLSNSTYNMYFIIDSGSGWNNLRRNLLDDLSYFVEDNRIITNIYMEIATGSSTKISVIFDDLNFIADVEGPHFSSLRMTNLPVYNADTIIDKIFFYDDNTEVTRVDLYYNRDRKSVV